MGSAVGISDRTAVAVAVGSIGLLVISAAFTSSTLLIGAVMTVAAVLAALSPLGGLCAVMATLPWFYQPLAIGSQAFALSELLLIATGVGTLVHLVVRWARDHASVASQVSFLWSIAKRPLVIVLVVLTTVGLALSIAPYDPSHRADSIREWRWVFAGPLLFVVMLYAVVLDRRSRWLLAMALIAGTAVASAQAMLDLVTAGGVAVEGVTRISGPFPHPNALALMTTRVAVLGIAWLAIDRSTRKLLAVPVMLAALATLATFSRGAWASLIAGVMVMTTFLDKRMRLAAIVAPVAVVALAIVVARDRMLSLFDGGSGSLRISIWGSALEMIRDRPILGYGPDQFLYAYLPRYVRPEAWNERFSAHAHNLILDFWIRLGIIGCAFALGVVIVCLVAVVGVVRRSGRGDGLATAAVVALAAAVVHGLVDDAYFSHELAMSGWLLAWLAFQPQEGSAAEGAQDGASPRLRRRRVHRVTSV